MTLYIQITDDNRTFTLSGASTQHMVDIIGDNMANVTRGGAAANVRHGAAGHNKLMGFGGNDCLLGGTGNDTLNGGIGAASYQITLGGNVNALDLSIGQAPGSDITF
ncbi:MAG TPA: hypothetical protein VNS22_03585 [Geminicoccus sp.]|uniref:hypothetical protein n=1 Tax=Geminicoccus sp. TaxID=2024832 RepID=UPI002B6FFD4B|nr:hypothetical protein [Geminicoccus sp.]HWL67447.1 hypothetical protein [Geminicoccus sp.]